MKPEAALETLKYQHNWLIEDEKRNGARSNMVFMVHAETVKEAMIALHDLVGWDAVHECTRYLKPQSVYQQYKGSAKIQTIGRHTVKNAIDRFYWHMEQKKSTEPA